MAQRDAHRAEQVAGVDRVGIPVGDRIGWAGKLIWLAVGKRKRLVAPVDFQLSSASTP